MDARGRVAQGGDRTRTAQYTGECRPHWFGFNGSVVILRGSSRTAYRLEYPKPDGEISFDILTSVSRTGTNHEEDQPVHLQVKDWDKHAQMEWPKYKGVENRFCPAGVYEYVEDDSKDLGVRFQINAQK